MCRNRLMVIGLLVMAVVAQADEQLRSFVASSSFALPEIVQFLQDQRSNSAFCDTVTFTMRIKGNEVTDVSVLEPVVINIFRLVWQLQHSKPDDMRWLDEVGSPIKETVELCSGSGNIHGEVDVSLEEFDTITLTMNAHRDAEYGKEIWADVVSRCTDLVVRCAEVPASECKKIMTAGLGRTLRNVMEMVNDQTNIHAEFELKFSDEEENYVCTQYTT